MASKVKSSVLKINRDLLDPDFQGYKLSLAPIWHHDVAIEGGIDQAFTSNDQYSYLHQREFSLFNHLYWNIWTRDGVYYVDKKRRVFKIRVRCTVKDSLHDRSDLCVSKNPSDFLEVWQDPSVKPREAGDYNISISFASKGIAVLGDGVDTVYLLDVQEDTPRWNVISSFQLGSPYSGFTVDSCRAFNGDNKVICLIRRIEKCKNPQPRKDQSNFENSISFLCFTRDEAGWNAELSDEVGCRGNIDYLAIEPTGDAAYLVVTDPHFGSPQPGDEEEQLPKYFWRQTFEELSIWFQANEEITKSDVKVSVASDKIRIEVKGVEYLTDKLFSSVEEGLSTFSVTDQKVEIVLQKSSPSMWTSCLEGTFGKEEVDEALARMAHENLSHMTSENETDPPPTLASSAIMEECDFVEVISRFLVRYDIQARHITHKIQLGDEQWLMTLPTEADKTPALCIRNDVDGSVWQPETPSLTGEWVCKHTLNFHALGYVQASKERRKFIISPPSGSYVAIVEIDGRVYIFRQNVSIGGTLKNRFSGKGLKTKAVQQVISLGARDPVLGAIAEEFHMFVLTGTHFYCLNLPEEC